MGKDEGGDLLFDVARRGRGHLPERVRLGLDDHVDLFEGKPGRFAADTRQGRIHLDDHGFGVFHDRADGALGAGEVEISLAVHRRDGDHRDVGREEVFIVPAHVAEDHRREEGAAAVAQAALVGRAVPGVVDEVVGLRVAFDDGERPLQQIAANLDAVQLVPALGQSGVERGGIGVVRAVVDPVAVLDDLDGLVRGAELGTVFGKEIHRVASCVFVRKSIARTAEGVKEKLPADRELFSSLPK